MVASAAPSPPFGMARGSGVLGRAGSRSGLLLCSGWRWFAGAAGLGSPAQIRWMVLKDLPIRLHGAAAAGVAVAAFAGVGGATAAAAAAYLTETRHVRRRRTRLTGPVLGAGPILSPAAASRRLPLPPLDIDAAGHPSASSGHKRRCSPFLQPTNLSLSLFITLTRTYGLLYVAVMQTGPTTAASGSAYAEFGKTKVIVLVFGPRESKKAMLYSDTGRLNCSVSYTTFATAILVVFHLLCSSVDTEHKTPTAVMAQTCLPPGFRFHPTDVELVSYYLKRKIMGKKLFVEAISEVELYKFAPWDLPDKSCLQSKDLEWFFFCPRDKKYPKGSRTNRATPNGYWKTSGKDRTIKLNSRIVGLKKTLIFHEGKAPKGNMTDWVMYEYKMEDETLDVAGFSKDAYVLCNIFKKSGLGPRIGEQYGAPFDENEWENLDVGSSIFSFAPSSGVEDPQVESSALATAVIQEPFAPPDHSIF
ncbi:hypothetical protein ZWY2020_050011 [Hordeum vulgare]|nr:hypothetical protein ZWY2020_050011 [Hordeum vulgare]